MLFSGDILIPDSVCIVGKERDCSFLFRCVTQNGAVCLYDVKFLIYVIYLLLFMNLLKMFKNSVFFIFCYLKNNDWTQIETLNF